MGLESQCRSTYIINFCTHVVMPARQKTLSSRGRSVKTRELYTAEHLRIVPRRHPTDLLSQTHAKSVNGNLIGSSANSMRQNRYSDISSLSCSQRQVPSFMEHEDLLSCSHEPVAHTYVRILSQINPVSSLPYPVFP